MKDKLYFKSPRQLRAILALLEVAIPVSDLGEKIGALNPRQVILELRRQGFAGIIGTRRFTVLDRDGRRCRPGEYYIPEVFKPMIEKMVKEQVSQSTAKPLGKTFEHKLTHNNRRTL